MRQVKYEVVDVFSRRRFRGNQLAVVPDATVLSTRRMQDIAVEFNYSEVAFVLPPADPVNTARLRIFTPEGEIPFAGHPTIGAAFVLAARGRSFARRIGSTMVLEEGAGPVAVTVLQRKGQPAGASAIVPRDLECGRQVDVATTAACLSLEPADVVLRRHQPTIVSVGLSFAVVEVASLDALRRAKPNAACFAEADRRFPVPDGLFSIYLYFRTRERPGRLRARMLSPLGSVPEDPGTGSAAAALGAFLTNLSPAADRSDRIVIEQGVEMGRHSILDVRATKRDGRIRAVSISGFCVPVMRGTIDC